MTFVSVTIVETKAEQQLRQLADERSALLYPRCTAEECTHGICCRNTDWYLAHSKRTVDHLILARRFEQYDKKYRIRFRWLAKMLNYESGRRYIATHN